MSASKADSTVRSDRQRKRVRKPKAKPVASPKTRFTAAMSTWLKNSGYHVGLSTQPVNTKSDLEFAKGAADVFTKVLNVASPMWITSGAGSKELFQALVPYFPLADLLGSKLQLEVVTLIPVVYADELDAAAVRQKLSDFIEMAGPLTEFGPRLNLQSQGSAHIQPLLVYFRPERFAADLPVLMPELWQKRIMRRIYLTAAMVNVAESTVTWPEKTGFFSIGEKLASWMGTKAKIFDNADLAAVLKLSAEPQ